MRASLYPCCLVPFSDDSRVLYLALCPCLPYCRGVPKLSLGLAGEGILMLSVSSQCSTVLYPRPGTVSALWHVKIVAASNLVSFLFLSVYLGDGFPQRLNVFVIFYMPSFFFWLLSSPRNYALKKKLVLFILFWLRWVFIVAHGLL